MLEFERFHKPVLQREVFAYWRAKEGGNYIDATLGTGGHTEQLLSQDASARCWGFDRDPEAVLVAGKRLERFKDRMKIYCQNYGKLREMVENKYVPQADGFLADLGFSSFQMDNPNRGFSFRHNGPLDMRMDNTSGRTALSLIQGAEVHELAQIIERYGEESNAFKIAAALKKAANVGKLNDTQSCQEVIAQALWHGGPNGRSRIDPATKTFQALRIAVNQELDHLNALLDNLPGMIAPGGRICFISFHSLEDRVVKNKFKLWSRGCVCPPKLPMCGCGRKPLVRLMNKKPITPGASELADNPRSRSAKLRIAEKL